MSKRTPYAIVADGTRKIHLDRIDPADCAGLDKKEGVDLAEKLGREFAELSNLLTYAGQQALLVVIQGRDASGKDGVIRRVLQSADVLSASVRAFKVPTPEEAGHDFLWRVHRAAPGKGQMVLFNRSHYEDVIAARVHQLVAAHTWKRRYRKINDFEGLLAANDTIVVKFCLHVSRHEQIQRLREREENSLTAWKLAVGDWRELPLWDQTTSAYDEALNRCSSRQLPFYVVPADHKWFRNLAVLERLVLTLRPFRRQWLKGLGDRRREALKEIRKIQRHLEK